MVVAIVAALLATALGITIYFIGWIRGCSTSSSNGDAFGNLVWEFRLGSIRDLRSILQQTNSYISGSTALHLLRPGRFYPNDIDFYVNSDGFPLLLAYMIDHDYKVSATTHGPHVQLSTATVSEPHPQEYKFHTAHIAVLLDMHHRSSPSLKISLIVSRSPHIVATITTFHSTIVMNYIAWYGMVSLYPQWTMQNLGLINRSNLEVGILEKYRGRGFTLCSSLEVIDGSHVCLHNAYCPQHLRNLHDAASLFLPFNDVETSLSALEPDVPWVLDVLCDSDINRRQTEN